LSLFGHTVKGDCPPHEIEYGDLKADGLYQPHRLADIAAFYSAFGLEVADNADERVDHIAMECEFYSVLCAKEAVAGNQIEFCRDAQKQFLRDHLARWTPAFSRRLERLGGNEFYQGVARLLRETVEAECARYAIQSGNADLQLRPAEELVDPCGACGLVNRE
jgi:TorA maturation chaperone TorD